MTKRINPALRRVWRDPWTIQYGYSPGVQIAELTPGKERLLNLLELGVADNQLNQIGNLARATEAEVGDLMARISPVLLHGGNPGVLLSSTEVDRRFAELLRAALITNQDPQALFEHRLGLRVFVSSLDRVGLLATRALAASGVGLIFTTDAGTVKMPDIGSLGYPLKSLGGSRLTAARMLIEQDKSTLQTHTLVSRAVFDRTDCAILVANEVMSPRVYQPWLASDVAHIGIIFDEAGVTVSPTVIPGETPCLGCLEVDSEILDPGWRALAPQLLHEPRDLADAPSALFAISVAAHRLLEICDSRAGFRQLTSGGHGLRLENSGLVKKIEYAKSNCGCRQDFRAETLQET